MKTSSSCVHVLHKTLNLVISRCCFAEDGKEMYQNLKRTRRAIAFAHEAFYFVSLLLLSPLSLVKFLIDNLVKKRFTTAYMPTKTLNSYNKRLASGLEYYT